MQEEFLRPCFYCGRGFAPRLCDFLLGGGRRTVPTRSSSSEGSKPASGRATAPCATTAPPSPLLPAFPVRPAGRLAPHDPLPGACRVPSQCARRHSRLPFCTWGISRRPGSGRGGCPKGAAEQKPAGRLFRNLLPGGAHDIRAGVRGALPPKWGRAGQGPPGEAGGGAGGGRAQFLGGSGP